MQRRPCFGAALALVAVVWPAYARQAGINTRVTIRVLFIGNSLTTAYNIPGLVQALAAGTDQEVVSRVVAFPDYSLQDHWVRGDAVRAIDEGGWSIVVLQQGPSALPESRVVLREYTRRFDAKIRRVGGRTALYMVWPSVQRRSDFEGVKLSYGGAAHSVGGLLLPVGEAWRAAWRRDGGLSLYGEDGFHPSAPGAYLAALVIYQQITGQSPIGRPSTLVVDAGQPARIAIPESRALLLQQAAADANAHAGR